MTALNFSREADKLKKHRRRLKEFVRLFTQSKRFRIVLYTAGSLTLNVAYAAYNGILGLFYGSIWFMILCVYYGLLAVMRYMAVSYEKKLDKGIQVVSEVYVMRFTGMMFIVMSVVLMLIELYSMIHNTARQYARLVIASIAVYTVIKLARAIINLIKVQQHRSPLLSAIRNISLADAGVSAVTLIRSLTVYAMWLSESDKLIIITCSGVIVYLTTLVLGVAMLLRHTDKNQSADKNAPITSDNSCDASKIDTVKERLTENFVKISDNVVDRYDAISDKANEKNEMLKEHFEERVRHIEEKRKNNDNKY